MKGYDNLFFCLIALILVSLVTLLHTVSAEARSTTPKMRCTKDSKSYWLRNSCRDGFVVSHKNRVFAQAEGVSQHESKVEIMKETCSDIDGGLFAPVKTRLYFPSTKRYLCFSRNGRVKTVHRKRVHKKGNLCAFFENTDFGSQDLSESKQYITLQSAHNPMWYLGFGPHRASRGGHQGRALTPEGYEYLMPRKMSARKRSHRVRTDKCDFKFSTGLYTPYNHHYEWSGMFEAVGRENSRVLEVRLNRALQTNSISLEEVSDEDDFDEKVFRRNQHRQINIRTKDLKSSSEEATPLPTPLPLKSKSRRRVHRKPSQAYFFNHNLRRDESSNPKYLQELDTKTPLF